MAIVITEKNIGRRINNTDSERMYTIAGATNELEAYLAFFDFIPPTLNEMFLDYQNTEVEEMAENLFVGVAKYKFLDFYFQQPDSFHISFDISGQSTHVTQSIATVANYPTAARNFKGALNVDQDGTIQGTDIIVPLLTYQINYTFPKTDINDTYIQTLTNIVGSYNNVPFKEFQAGTCLLTKVSGQQREDLNWDLSFGFSVSKNRTSFLVGDITVASKLGWQYMWVYYMDAPATTTDSVTYTRKIPKSVHIEELYPSNSFAGLNLG